MGMELWFWRVIHNILPTNLPIYLQFSTQNLIFYLFLWCQMTPHPIVWVCLCIPALKIQVFSVVKASTKLTIYITWKPS